MTREELITAIQRCAEEMGRVPTLAEVRRATKLSRHAIKRHFSSYSRALAACGLRRTGPGYSADAMTLFVDWAKLVRKLGNVPTMAEYELEGYYSVRPLTKRYKGWTHVPAGMLEYARRERLEGEWGDVLDVVTRYLGRAEEEGRTSGRNNGPYLATVSPLWQQKLVPDQPVYGMPLLPTPLSHAPTNELGVVFLFGAVAREMGFMVMRLQAEFPDCEAMREVEPGRWQRARIEVEYESRNFLTHRHPVDGCDLIVCWNHNWKDCPIEVLELKRVIGAQQKPTTETRRHGENKIENLTTDEHG